MTAEHKNAGAMVREDRYIVIKRKDLDLVPASYRKDLVDPLPWLQVHLPERKCLVIESDWPEYEPAWRMIEARVNGAEQTPAVGDSIQWAELGLPLAVLKEAFTSRDSAERVANMNVAGAITKAFEEYQRIRAHVASLLTGVTSERDELATDRDSLAFDVLQATAELQASEARNTALEQAIWLTLDNSGDTDEEGIIGIMRQDFDKLCALVPEDWQGQHDLVTQSAPATDEQGAGS